MVFSGNGWARVIADVFVWMVLDDCGWFWLVEDVLGGFRWFSEVCCFSNSGEIRCFKFKRSRQLWEVLVVSSNRDTNVPLKRMTKFLGNSECKVSLKKILVGWEKKLTCITLCKFSRSWLRSSSFWDNFSRISSFGLLLVGSSLFYAEYLTNIIIYWNPVVIIFSNFQWSLDIFKKVITFRLETSRKNQVLIYSRTMNILSCK